MESFKQEGRGASKRLKRREVGEPGKKLQREEVLEEPGGAHIRGAGPTTILRNCKSPDRGSRGSVLLGSEESRKGE